MYNTNKIATILEMFPAEQSGRDWPTVDRVYIAVIYLTRRGTGSYCPLQSQASTGNWPLIKAVLNLSKIGPLPGRKLGTRSLSQCSAYSNGITI